MIYIVGVYKANYLSMVLRNSSPTKESFGSVNY